MKQNIKLVNPNSEFIFIRNGERLTKRTVTYWLSKYCKEAGITYKSPHCMRADYIQQECLWI